MKKITILLLLIFAGNEMFSQETPPKNKVENF